MGTIGPFLRGLAQMDSVQVELEAWLSGTASRVLLAYGIDPRKHKGITTPF
jgi:hypothetical protein